MQVTDTNIDRSPMQDLEKFSALGLSPRTIAALIEKGFEEPTQIQAECIPLLL